MVDVAKSKRSISWLWYLSRVSFTFGSRAMCATLTGLIAASLNSSVARLDKKTSWFGEDVAMSEYIMGITLDEVMYLSSPGPLTWIAHATPDSDP